MDLLLGAAGVLDAGALQGLIHALLALSVVITLLSLDFPDLSIEGTFPFGAALGAVLLVDAHLHPVIVLLCTAAAGAGAGAVTGALHVRFGMSKLLSGISVAAMLYSASLLIMAGRAGVPLLEGTTLFTPFEAIDRWANEAAGTGGKFFFHPGSMLAVAAVAVITLLVVNRILLSEFGVVLRALGMNEPALRHFGREPGAFKIAGVAIGNALASMAGALSSQFQGFADVNMGVGVLASSLLAVILGQEIFSRLKLRLDRPQNLTLAAVAGAMTYQVLISGILSAGAPPTALRFLAGFALVLLVALRSRRSEMAFRW